MIDAPSILVQAERSGFSCAFYEFRKAKTPGVDYFNSALVRRHDGLWLITRRSEFLADFAFGQNELMAFHLDEEHLPLYGKQVKCDKVSAREHFEDPRAVWHAGKYWLSACNFVVYAREGTWTGAHQVLLEINEAWQTERRHDPIYGKNGASVFDQKGDEKNWIWFSHDGELHLIYMTQPHMVVRWDEAMRPVEEYETHFWHPDWKHGLPRGGTNPVRVGNQYVAFFHSSTEWRNGKRRYHMGAYTFEARPPFRVTSVTPKPLLSGSIDDPWAEGKPLCVFPCAALHEFGVWTVSLGVNDLTSARATLTDAVLMARLSREVAEISVAKVEKSRLETVFG